MKGVSPCSCDKDGGQMLSPRLQGLDGPIFNTKHREVNTTQSQVSQSDFVCVYECVVSVAVLEGRLSKRLDKSVHL